MVRCLITLRLIISSPLVVALVVEQIPSRWWLTEHAHTAIYEIIFKNVKRFYLITPSTTVQQRCQTQSRKFLVRIATSLIFSVKFSCQLQNNRISDSLIDKRTCISRMGCQKLRIRLDYDYFQFVFEVVFELRAFGDAFRKPCLRNLCFSFFTSLNNSTVTESQLEKVIKSMSYMTYCLGNISNDTIN